MTRFAIALGSNQGARLDHLRRAVADLRRAGAIVAVSPLYETAPIGGPSQDPYLNAVLLLDSSFAPSDLLGLLQEVETAHDRVRELRWGPRTLDLDIVAMDEGPVDTPELQVPHPRARERRFVIEPLCQVWPDALVGEALSAASAKEWVQDQEVVLVATDWLEDDSEAAANGVE
jgi:2-amino-4-hydroxy-6-hydroxymethyldihydropteridine diphosphokinase